MNFWIFSIFLFFPIGVRCEKLIAYVNNGNIWLMHSNGSQKKQITFVEKGRGEEKANIVGPLSWSPDNKKIVFAREGWLSIRYPDGGGGWQPLSDLWIMNTDGSEIQNITNNYGSSRPSWSPKEDKIVFNYDSMATNINACTPIVDVVIMSNVLHAKKSIVEARKTFITDEIQKFNIEGACGPVFSPDGAKILFEMVTGGPHGIEIMDMEGKIIYTLKEMFMTPTWNQDGTKIACAPGGIWIIDIQQKTRKQILNDKGKEINHLSWSSDGKHIAFSAREWPNTEWNIYTIKSNGEDLKQITNDGKNFYPEWSH
ncbi:MAG: hypothetical protein WC614_08650 [bacterium]